MKRLEKSSTDKAIVGVCGGIAEYFGIPSIAARLIFMVTPAALIIYIILGATLPEKPPSL
ncbi:PspC domain-containing protein [Salicibibacter cibarius]|uniref:PspC domain-containing protein n=1 Tax=Salicibibacter cibarius TaxID=2743000 RepID=A0A7T7CA87_9BACI|nr:PspC domain-containing protein [Salicibibacter cibarius]QQK74464.1 PspC domain-containing protein [Salicibibacter cibarius]